MLNFLPDLHEGHAPITLQQLFGDAARIATALTEQRRLYGEAAIASFLDHNRVDKRRPA